MIKGGPRVVTDGLVLCLDAHDAKSYAGEPVTNLYGDMSTSTALRPNRTEYNTGGTWPSDMPMCPEPVGRVYKHTSGALTSSWSGNSYGYTLKDIATTSGETYICTCWVFVSADCDIDYMYLGIEGYSSGAGIPSGYTQVYNLNNKGTWQQLALYVIADTNVRFLPVYPRRSGVTDGSFSGFYAWGGAQVVEAKNYITPFVLSSRSATDAWVDRSGNSSHGDFYNGLDTGVSHYRDGQVIMPVANSYLEFNGTNQSIIIDDVSNISLTSGSVEAWVKMDSISGNKVIVAYGGNGTNTGWLLQSENSTSNKIGFLVFGAASAYSGNTLSTGYLNNWTHFIGTYGGGAVKFYANGALVTSTATSTNVSSSSTLRVGNEYNRSYFLDGQLGLVRIYNKTLTAAEVLSNYNATKGRFS